MSKLISRLSYAACVAGLFAGLVWHPAIAAPATTAHLPAARVSGAAEALAQRVLADGDTVGRPFAVVDKRSATIAVYRADGSLAGVSRALLGQAVGDRSLPGVGERTQTGTLRPEDRTTPAGRFLTTPGRNRSGEAIVWVDYRAAFAIHRLRPGPERAERARRLNTADAGDKRMSAGCVVVPESFYDGVVQPVLGSRAGVVYVMPERGDEAPSDASVAGL